MNPNEPISHHDACSGRKTKPTLTLSQMLTLPAKRKLLNRWKSIKKHALENIDYAGNGSYGHGLDCHTTDALDRDRAAIDDIDRLIKEALR